MKMTEKGLLTITAILAIISIVLNVKYPTFTFHTVLAMLWFGYQAAERLDELYKQEDDC